MPFFVFITIYHTSPEGGGHRISPFEVSHCSISKASCRIFASLWCGSQVSCIIFENLPLMREVSFAYGKNLWFCQLPPTWGAFVVFRSLTVPVKLHNDRELRSNLLSWGDLIHPHCIVSQAKHTIFICPLWWWGVTVGDGGETAYRCSGLSPSFPLRAVSSGQ